MTASTREDRSLSSSTPADGAAAGVATRPGPAVARIRNGIRARMTLARSGLLVALVVGAVLRLIDLGRVGLNSDEAVYAGQAASMAGNAHFTGIFPVVRAHPLLVQMIASPLYASGRPDVAGRYIAAAFGLATIAMVYVLGGVLYRPRVAALAALLLAVMPYHVTITRQFLLDGPMTFFTTAALVCMAKAVDTATPRWFVGAGACLGAAALCKETGLVLAVAALGFLCVYARAWRSGRFIMAAAGVALGLTAAYPLITALSGGGHNGQSYLLWQLTRQPNHGPSFYPVVVGASVGFVLLAVAAYGLLIGRTVCWQELLLLSWIGIPLVYF
ncbi:MAG TPA: glycosyltransferase family 39 protein, partial [Mycobacterium sp.]|nr:glycosyltransferase family 39 protein [Mycobacterium sp.]